jgi:hypothetical protein
MGKSFSHPCEISQPRAQYRRKCGNWFRPFEVQRDTPPGHHKMDSHGTKIWSPTSLTNSLHTKSHKTAHTTQNHPDSIQHWSTWMESGWFRSELPFTRSDRGNYQKLFGKVRRSSKKCLQPKTESAAQPQNRQGLARFPSLADISVLALSRIISIWFVLIDEDNDQNSGSETVQQDRMRHASWTTIRRNGSKFAVVVLFIHPGHCNVERRKRNTTKWIGGGWFHGLAGQHILRPRRSIQ